MVKINRKVYKDYEKRRSSSYSLTCPNAIRKQVSFTGQTVRRALSDSMILKDVGSILGRIKMVKFEIKIKYDTI